jgi:hypothetical protein
LKRLVIISLSLLLILIPGCITVQMPPSATIPPSGASTVIGAFNSNPTTINSGQLINGVMGTTLSAVSGESGSIVKTMSQGTGEAIYNTTLNTACIGDSSGNFENRAFLSFDISAIPQTAVIQEAILDLSNYTKTGTPSYQTMYGGMGAMLVYHHQYGKLSTEATITSPIWWNRTAKLTANGSIINYPQSPWAWDVKNSETGESVIQTLVQTGQTRSQFMMQFFSSTDWDNEADMLCFSNPTLTIKYTMP